MFHAVRQWWSGGRGKVTARLFLFELVVVTLGVMLAQGLSDWNSNRSIQRQVEEERARLDFEVGRSYQAALVWKAAIPCLRDRVDLMLRAVSTDANLQPADTEFPRSGAYSVEVISGDMARPFRDRYGSERTDIYALAINTGEAIDATVADIRSEWAKFELLGTDVGALNDADRATLRSAGVRIRWLLRLLADRQVRIEEIAQQLGIKPIGSGKALAIPDVPIRQCAEIWRNGHIWHVGP